jgi:endoglucanase
MKNRNLRSLRILIIFIILILSATTMLFASDYLHTQGSKIVESSGNEVWLTGVNWFGFETSNNAFHGIWARDMKQLLDTVANLGFNIIRVPLNAQLVAAWAAGNSPMPSSVNTYQMNDYLVGKNSLEVLDIAIDYCGQIGLKIMLDMHSIAPDGYMNEQTWYTGTFTTQNYINAWKFLATHYKGNDVVVACDLKNEPHGNYSQGTTRAQWNGTSDTNNWRKAAQDIGSAILSINPDVLIMVEGIECYPMEGKDWSSNQAGDYYSNWWGGMLRGVKDFPVNLGSYQNKLVYSPHEYGPSVFNQSWFQPDFDTNKLLTVVWRPNWFYIYEANTAPLLIGEWGGNLSVGATSQWMGDLVGFMAQYKVSHTFWCLNPNSGDTGGLLLDDWTTVDTTKYNIVKPAIWKDNSGKFIGLDHEIVLGSSGTNVTQYYGGVITTTAPTDAPTAEVTPIPTITTTAQPGCSYALGDANGNGSIDIVDALIVAQYYVGLISAGFQSCGADVNKDGSIDIVDALKIAQCYVGLISCSF